MDDFIFITVPDKLRIITKIYAIYNRFITVFKLIENRKKNAKSSIIKVLNIKIDTLIIIIKLLNRKLRKTTLLTLKLLNRRKVIRFEIEKITGYLSFYLLIISLSCTFLPNFWRILFIYGFYTYLTFLKKARINIF